MDGWVDGWMDGSVRTSFFFAYFSKTTRYILLATFGPPTRRFKTSVVKKWKKKSISKYVKNRLTKRVYFPKKVLRIPLYFHGFFFNPNFFSTPSFLPLKFFTPIFFYPHFFFTHIFFYPQNFFNPVFFTPIFFHPLFF